MLLYKLSLIEFLPSRLRQKLTFSSITANRDPDAGELEPDIVLPLPAVLRSILEELGPTYIKLGQIMSTRGDIIPAPYIEELSKLQAHVTPAPWEEMEPIILSELGGGRFQHVTELFENFDPIPLASGSLGQAYKASILVDDNKVHDVILKVQRPYIEQIIESDIAVMLEFARLLNARTNWGKWNNILGVTEEFAQVIRGELDFSREGHNTEAIGRSIQKAYGDDIITPKVYWEYSTKRVLTLEFLSGEKVSTLFDGRLPLAESKAIAQKITDAFLYQVFVDGFFHADPHPGNLLVVPGRYRTSLALIDFGMVGRIDPRSRELLTDFLFAILNFDVTKAADRLLEYGQPTQPVDKHCLTVDIDHILREGMGRPLQEVQMGHILQSILDLMIRYRVRMPSSFLMLVRMFVTLEGICRQLDPDYMLINNAKPFVLGHLKRQFTQSLSGMEILKMAVDWKNIIKRFPRRVDDLLFQANAGQLRIEYDFKDLRRVERTLTVVGNKLSFSILVAALVMGGAISMLARSGPKMWGVPAFSVIIFVTSAIMGLWLLISIIRSGQLK